MPEGTVFFADEPILRDHRAVAAGAAGRVAAYQYPAFPVADRRQGGAHGAGGARQAAGRFRPAPRPWRAKPDCWRRAPATSRALPAPPPCSPTSSSASRSSAPWRIPSSRSTTTKAPHSRISRAPGRENLTLLIDTYDTEAAARKVVALAPRLKARGITIRGVRLDSGDLLALSRKVRRILDEGGLADVNIFASGGLDEDKLAELVALRRPDRRLRHRHEPDHLLRRAGARLRLQAAGICRAAAAQALHRQGDLARPQAGLAQLRRGRPDDRRRAVARGRSPGG